MRILIAAATSLLLFPQGAAAQDMRVLFLGNSYTARNNLPGLVQGLSAASGRTMLVDANTPGGNTLGAPQGSGASHSTNQVSEQKIAAQPWDVVVLQDQSYIPTIPFGKTNWMFTGAQAIQLKVDAAAPGTRVMLYQTWGRKAGGQFSWAGRSSPNFGSYGAMQDALSNAYGECGSLVGAEVATVGEAWRRSQNLRPALELYSADQSHPALAGSYLAACVFHAQIYAESPVGLAYTAGLDPSVAAFLQRVAADVVRPSGTPVRPHVRLDPGSMSGTDLAGWSLCRPRKRRLPRGLGRCWRRRPKPPGHPLRTLHRRRQNLVCAGTGRRWR